MTAWCGGDRWGRAGDSSREIDGKENDDDDNTGAHIKKKFDHFLVFLVSTCAVRPLFGLYQFHINPFL
jgi:hypothetical protein